MRTLGEILYARKSDVWVPERDWVRRVSQMSTGDQQALYTLYDRTQRLVYTLIVRITKNRQAAQEKTLDVFHEVWRGASTYDPEKQGSVVGWILNLARLRALNSAASGQRNKGAALSPWGRLVRAISEESGKRPVFPMLESESRLYWEDVALGISVKMLAVDEDRQRVSMMVRLAPNTDYPPHRHAGQEELHLLDGELMIDAKKLCPGDYSRAEQGSVDNRVWSVTGCTCVLMTSVDDAIIEPGT